MLIPTRDIPQADELSDVLKVIEAVADGATTYQNIAHAIGKVQRQGRYYRRAAEILGLIDHSGTNLSSLTQNGLAFMRASGRKRRTLVLKALLSTRIFQRVIPFLESKLPRGCEPGDFKAFLEAVTEPTGETMMPRRANTLIGWLRSVGLVVVSHDRYVLCALPKELDAIRFVDEAEPLLPAGFSLVDYIDVQAKASTSAGTIKHFVDEAKLERANEAHKMLTNLVAQRIRAAGVIPRYNNLVDLAARISNTPFIFEMKSTGNTNIRAQVRRGISQLYEYRYLQNLPDTKLVLVIEQPLSTELAWMADYLTKDREILLAWDGDRKHLHCSESQKAALHFLVA